MILSQEQDLNSSLMDSVYDGKDDMEKIPETIRSPIGLCLPTTSPFLVFVRLFACKMKSVVAFALHLQDRI